MAKNSKKKKANGNGGGNGDERDPRGGAHHSNSRLHPDTTKSIWAIGFFCLAVILTLAGFKTAGPLGALIYQGLYALLGWGYFILPLTLVFAAAVFIFSERRRFVGMTLFGSSLLILSVLALIELAQPTKGGWLGLIFGSLRIPFGNIAAVVINCFLLIVAILVTANVPLKLKWWASVEDDEEDDDEVVASAPLKKVVVANSENGARENEKANGNGKNGRKEPLKEVNVAENDMDAAGGTGPLKKLKPATFANYTPPPLSLLSQETSKPTTGDLLANANIIKRTLESFGIPVEMGEINVGPAVTRYTLKPAEGVKLSRITALNPDLALSLAAHPIRIEAPIPGKSLVGIEVPNKAAAIVRLGSLMNYPEFQKTGLLGFVLGRDVSGEPIFASIEKMPHMLVAGATGSGKSILVHSLLTSLLFKNSPETLKMILIDPKRVELSIYDGLPHLVSPVITENKKAAGVFRWAIAEMERRYETLQKSGCRDIKSYNATRPGGAAGVAGKGGADAEPPMPFILIAVDELADLMSSFGREVEGSIVRLAQMARAVGIHLLLATQRPSVEVITGLIKANITARVALQVASQIDSRTILDTPGAEKLLGHGDLLFLSAELSKPKRIQGAFITEEEIKKVTAFIRENNKEEIEAAAGAQIAFEPAKVVSGAATSGSSAPAGVQNFDDFMNNEAANGDDDDLLEEALAVVLEAKKASASLLQRRLKVGYARAARLLDIMQDGDFIGPGEGAKPRDVNEERIMQRLG